MVSCFWCCVSQNPDLEPCPVGRGGNGGVNGGIPTNGITTANGSEPQMIKANKGMILRKVCLLFFLGWFLRPFPKYVTSVCGIYSLSATARERTSFTRTRSRRAEPNPRAGTSCDQGNAPPLRILTLRLQQQLNRLIPPIPSIFPNLPSPIPIFMGIGEEVGDGDGC